MSTQTLELEYESGGSRHYLDGRPVHCGTGIEIQLGGERGPWLPVRYEADLMENGIRVTLHTVGGIILFNAAARFRWPGGRS